MNKPVIEDLLHDIFNVVRERIQLGLNADLGNGIDPAGTINAEIVLNALDWSKGPLAQHFGIDEVNLYSRAAPLAGTEWATESQNRHGWRMLEYLLDFSVSHGSIPMAIRQGIHQLPAGVKFEMLLGAESEMGTEAEVCRDLLKLLDTRSRIKVMLFVARSSKAWVNKLKSQMENVLNSHAYGPADAAWLFMGVPSYSQWCTYEPNRKDTPRQVYILDPSGQSHVLIDKTDWWQL